MENDDPLIGKEIANCRLQRKLGQGGMGAVYLAHHAGLNKSVAIKLLTGELALSAEFKERFVREARLAARLEHPNVVQVHDVGQADGLQYISMQYVEGKSLDAVLKERKKLSVNEALSITKRVAVALSAAAKLGIVHRDIKPHNILISKDGLVKVADFGLAKDNDANRSISEPGTIMGTPYYMSPEQAKGVQVDHRSDIYSLGATLYHMLTGKRLFDGGSPVGIVMKQASEPPIPAKELEPSIPDPVAALLGKMLEKDPARRFQTADELVRALDALKQPGATIPPGSVAPAAPPKRKAAMIALPIAGILVVGIVLGLILGHGGSRPADPTPAPPPSQRAEPPPAAVKPPDEKPAPPLPTTPIKPPPEQTPVEKVLSKMKDAAERKAAEELMARTEELLQALQKKDLKTLRNMLDTLSYGEITDAQIAELSARIQTDKGSLEGWEFQEVDVRTRVFGRPQPHATVVMTFTIKIPKGEIKLTDQPIHWIRKIDGKWYVTKVPKKP